MTTTAFSSLDYLDHPATSRPKAPGVVEAMVRALTEVCASAERSNHRLGALADEIVVSTRRKVAAAFCLGSPDSVVFTPGATWALNLALKGILNPGDHVVTTSWEHNSVLRPLMRLRELGCEVTIVRSQDPNDITKQITRALRPNTRVVAITHASNVCGTILPVLEVASRVRAAGALVLLDASQTVGHFDFDLQLMPVDLVAFSGHKGMLGPQGIGCLLVANPDIEIRALVDGGTGHNSADLRPSPICPGGLEAGTLNLPAIAGLGAALDFVSSDNYKAERQIAQALREECIAGLRELSSAIIYSHTNCEAVPVVSFNLKDVAPTVVARQLDLVSGIEVRAGLHCAPLAHETLGTGARGSIRVGFGYGNEAGCVERLCKALYAISRGAA
jgi:selenocysteine lyase/cysteine desulfurase